MKKHWNKGFTLIELIVVVAILGIFMTIVVGGIGGCTASEGIRVGTVTKFSLKGVAYKTHEGELLMGGLRQAEVGIVANIWQFSVPPENSNVVKQIEAAMLSGKPVALYYKQARIPSPSKGSTLYYVYRAAYQDASLDKKE